MQAFKADATTFVFSTSMEFNKFQSIRSASCNHNYITSKFQTYDLGTRDYSENPIELDSNSGFPFWGRSFIADSARNRPVG